MERTRRIAWLSVEDIEYEFGYRISALKHLKENGIDTIVFIVGISNDITDEYEPEMIAHIKNILELSMRFSIKPIIAFATDHYAVTIIPKTEEMFRFILEFPENKPNLDFHLYHFKDIVQGERRKEILLGQSLYQVEFNTPYDKNDFCIMEKKGTKRNNNDLCKKAISKDILVMYDYKLFENYYVAYLPFNKLEITSDEFSYLDEISKDWVLEKSPEIFLNEIEDLDYGQIIEEYC